MDRAQNVWNEIDRITDLEGFLEFCRDLRDSMTFYDREVLLAIASGILEGMWVTAMYFAALDGEQALDDTVDRLDRRLDELPERLRYDAGALDIQAFLERFVETAYPTLREEFPVLAGSITHWSQDDYDLEADPNVLLAQARRVFDEDEATALELVCRVGAMLLRGVKVPSVWVHAGGPIVPWIQGMMSLPDTLLSIPGASVPLGDVASERAHVNLVPGVVSLEMFRRFRSGGPEPPRVADSETEAFWRAVFAGGRQLNPQAARWAEAHPDRVRPLLLTIAQAPELRDPDAEGAGMAPVHAVRLLTRMHCEEAVYSFLDILQEADPDEPVFQEARRGLIELGPPVTLKVLRFADQEADLWTAVFLSEVLARGRKDERVYRFLAGLFQRATWRDGKELVVGSLATYGDRRALPLLKEELATASGRSTGQERVLKAAIRRLQRRDG